MKNTDKNRQSFPVSRREFITRAGTLLGGALVGTSVLSGCTGVESRIDPSIKLQYVCPYDGRTFDSFEELTTYIETNFRGQQPIAKFISPYDGKEFSSLLELKDHLDNLFSSARFTSLNINGQDYNIAIEDHWSLSFVIREKFGLTGTKIGCDRGSCGACTVILDGEPIYSCLVLAIEAEGKQITTIEGLSNGIDLDPVQQAFVDGDAVQCGYCTPGFIMTAKALLDRNENPTRDEIRQALSGHLCICGHTKKIVDAVLAVSEQAAP